MPTHAHPTPANRLGLDYRAEADRLGTPPVPIIDGHAHINGGRAAAIYKDAMDAFGVTTVYSQSRLSEADAVQHTLGERIRFVAVPDYMSDDPKHAHTRGYLDAIKEWHARGARMLKFWCAPRGRDFGKDMGDPTILTFDNPWRRKQLDLAAELGMVFMTHIADPDTWFATKYTDASFYGTKREQYEPLSRITDAYPDTPWLVAHMGGWPEDLGFLTELLERHPQFVLDTSATKWMVRELSKHPRDEMLTFFTKFRDRIVFGSDIVTMDAHLSSDEGPRGMGTQASGEAEAFDLYASRYYALRTMFETDYDDESPIADPDLAMVDPDGHDAMSAPALRGKSFPTDLLKDLYRGTAERTLERWYGLA
ncbi:MAG: amidohydrolase family protein [Planctomycetota bacterium]